MKRQDLLLSQFTPEVGVQLMHFGRHLASIEADILVFMARASMCLYDLLVSLSSPPCEQLLVTDRVLDLALDPFGGKRVALIDDTLILGSTLAKTKRRLEETAAAVTTHTFCVDSEWWSRELIKPESIGLELTDAQVMNFCAAEVQAFALLPRPYVVDFPFSQPIRLRRDEHSELLSSVTWTTRSVTSSLQEESGIAVSSFFPGEDVLEVLRKGLPESVFDVLDIMKVRSFSRRVGKNHWTTLVPMITLRPIHEKELESLFLWLIGCLERHSRQDFERFITACSSSVARLMASQFILSLCLGNLFFDSLPLESSIRKRLGHSPVEGERLFGPWFASEVAAIVEHSSLASFSADADPTLSLSLSLSNANALERDEWAADAIRDSWSSLEEIEVGEPNDRALADVRSLVGEFGAIFLRLHEKYEIPAREEVRRLGERAVTASATEAPNKDRLQWGIPWRVLVDELSSRYQVSDRRSAANLFSLVLDVCHDLGVAVPITRIDSRGSVYRAYRHGENVEFLLQDDFLAWSLFRGVCDGSSRETVPRLVAEKALVLLMKVGPALNFMKPIFGRTGGENIVRIDFDLKGAVSVFSRRLSDHRDRDLWLTRHLAERKVLRVSKEGGPYLLGGPPRGHSSRPGAALSAKQLGFILGTLLQAKGSDDAPRGPLDDGALILLSTCATPRSTAAALAAELRIFTAWYEGIGRNLFDEVVLEDQGRAAEALRGLRSSRGYEALNSVSLKYRGFLSGKPRKIVADCREFLATHSSYPLAAETWETYWRAILGETAPGESREFRKWIEKASQLAWELHSLVSVLEIALEGAAISSPKGKGAPSESRGADLLLSFDSQMERSAESVPEIVRQINRRFGGRGSAIPRKRLPAALEYCRSNLESRVVPAKNLAEDIRILYEDFDNRLGRHDYQYLLWYDIVDSTATQAVPAGADVPAHRRKVKAFKARFNGQLKDLAYSARRQRANVYSFLGDLSSFNDEKHIFFSGEFSMRHLVQVLDALLDCAGTSGVSVRVLLVRTDFAGGSRAYRYEGDSEVSGETFWEHLSRLRKGLRSIEDDVMVGSSFLAVAGELYKEIESEIGMHWQKSVRHDVASEIAGLTRVTQVVCGPVAGGE